MRLNELFEAEGRHVTFVFGRMNPPTIGHKQLLDTAKSVGGEYKIFLSQTQDPKKNPLDYQTKIKFVKEMFPNHADSVVDDAGLNTVVKVADYLYNMGYKNATFVAGSDRLDAMKQLLTQYNGVEGKAHGFYKFDVLDFKSSGEREDGAEGVAGVSASNARAAAASGDLDAFKDATGAGQHAKSLFSAVRKGMGIQEESIMKISDVVESRGRKVVTAKLADIERRKEPQAGKSPAQVRAEKEKKPKKDVAEGSLNEGQYEMMMRNGQVKKFIAKDDADAKRIAAGHGAKSVIKLRGGVPAGKVAEAADRPMPKTDLRVGDHVVADTSKEQYPGGHKSRSGVVTRIGQTGVHIQPDDGGEREYHPYKIVKKSQG